MHMPTHGTTSALTIIAQTVGSQIGETIAWTAAGIGALIGIHSWRDKLLERKIVQVAQRDLVSQKLDQIHSDVGELKAGYKTLDTKIDGLSDEVAFLRGAETGRAERESARESDGANGPPNRSRLRVKSDPPRTNDANR